MGVGRTTSPTWDGWGAHWPPGTPFSERGSLLGLRVRVRFTPSVRSSDACHGESYQAYLLVEPISVNTSSSRWSNAYLCRLCSSIPPRFTRGKVPFARPRKEARSYIAPPRIARRCPTRRCVQVSPCRSFQTRRSKSSPRGEPRVGRKVMHATAPWWLAP